MKLKKIFATFLLITLIFCLSGCAKVEHNRVIYTNGKVIDAISVKLDEEKIVEAGVDLAKLRTKIKDKMQQYLDALERAFYLRDDGLTYSEKRTMRILKIVTGVDEKEGYIYATINFRDYDTFRYFYGLHLQEDLSDNENETQSSTFLYTKTISTSQTVFAGSACEDIAQDFLDDYGDTFSLDDVEFSFLLGMPETRFHANADYSFTQDGVMYFRWNLSSTDEKIMTFTYLLKPVNWYILALALTFVLLIILILCAQITYFFKKYSHKKI